MITLHLYRDREGDAVAKIDSPEGRRALTDAEKADALTLLMLATAHTPNRHPREVAERRITSNLTSLMRTKLAQRRHHGDWRSLAVNQAMDLLRAEFAELEDTLTDADRIAEAVDVAACCAILIDVLRMEAQSGA